MHASCISEIKLNVVFLLISTVLISLPLLHYPFLLVHIIRPVGAATVGTGLTVPLFSLKKKRERWRGRRKEKWKGGGERGRRKEKRKEDRRLEGDKCHDHRVITRLITRRTRTSKWLCHFFHYYETHYHINRRKALCHKTFSSNRKS